MANTEIKHQLNVQSMDNPLAKEKGEKRFVLIPNGIADFNRVIAEMMAVNPGFEREIVEAVVKLEHRTIQRLTLSGMRVSNGLFTAVASPKGRAGASWDPSVNQLNITISQGASWREAIRNTTVNVVGDKSEVMYISNVIDVSTQSTDRTATVGYPFFVEGNYLKIAGEDPSVGIFLINGEDEETRIDASMIVINEPKKLAFYLSEHADEEFVGISLSYSSCFRLKSRWDKYAVPLPFSRVTVAVKDYGIVKKSQIPELPVNADYVRDLCADSREPEAAVKQIGAL